MKIGFIGFGNMASAIAGGLAKSGAVAPQEVCVFDVSAQAMNAARAIGFVLMQSEEEVVSNAQYIFLCIKPQGFPELLGKLAPYVRPENTFLSIAAGITMQSITNALGEVPVIRAMPNTPLLLGVGTTALAKNNIATDEAFSFVEAVFRSVGTVYAIEEHHFNDIINVNGSTPAFLYLFAKTIADHAAAQGIAYETALAMFCDTMKGSAQMLMQSGHSAETLIQMVSSKGGTTVAALETFEKTGFSDSLKAGMTACAARAQELTIS